MRKAGSFLTGVMALALLILAAFCTPKDKAVGEDSLEMAVCGWDSVFILRLDSPADSVGRVVWSWTAAESPELPDSMKARFGSTDECKPVDGGRAILITSSGDGVVLVERATKKVLFWASAVNAHSADLLPGGMVAVAASHRADAPGDRLLLFGPGTPGRVLEYHELSWGHGVVWDGHRQRLYALGNDLVMVYRLNNTSSAAKRLEEVTRIALPEPGGHEMFPVPGLQQLNLSTGRHCWLLNRDTGRIIQHPTLWEQANVKCISVHPRTGQTAWIQAEGDDWWATRIRFSDPSNTVLMPERKLYKVRWF